MLKTLLYCFGASAVLLANGVTIAASPSNGLIGNWILADGQGTGRQICPALRYEFGSGTQTTNMGSAGPQFPARRYTINISYAGGGSTVYVLIQNAPHVTWHILSASQIQDDTGMQCTYNRAP